MHIVSFKIIFWYEKGLCVSLGRVKICEFLNLIIVVLKGVIVVLKGMG